MSSNKKPVPMTTLFGGRWAGFQLGHRKTKRYMSKCSTDIIEYLNEWFSGSGHDSGFFSLETLSSECEYSKSWVRKSLKEISKKEVMLIRELGDNKYMILINKPDNVDYLKCIDEGKVEILQSLFTKPLIESEDNPVKRISNQVKKIFSKSSKSVSESSNTPTESYKSVKESQRIFIKVGQSSYSLDFSESAKQALDLYLIDLYLIDHHHYNSKFWKPLFNETDKKTDDDSLKIFEKENTKDISKDSISDLNKNPESDNLQEDDITTKKVPAVAAAQIVDNSGFDVDSEKNELLAIFKELRNKAGNLVNYDMEHADEILSDPNTDRKFIRQELKYFPFRVDKDGKAVGPGYLRAIFKKGYSEAPPAYTETVKLTEVKEIEKRNSQLLNIWGINEAIADLRVLKKFLHESIEKYFYAGRISEIKQNLSKMKALCEITEVLPKCSFELINQI